MTKLKNIKGVLLDLEGVLYSGDKLIDGVLETINKLKSKNLVIRYITNTTTTPRNSVFNKLRNFNLPVNDSDVFSPTMGANIYLNEKKIKKIYLLTNQSLIKDFDSFEINENDPEAVIIGDIYKEFNWENLNKAFQLINKNNSEIIALHKNKYCKREDKITLDLGPFVQALEYASDKSAIAIGKPEKKFFDLVLKNMNLPIDQVVMVGDDILSDISGAKKNNIMAIQVKTGKYQKKDEDSCFVQPDLRINSIFNLPDVLEL
tara:strand:- start:635 stop:1417 length:783 start_codon:yes stop_codon:yes gene_type:complete